MSSLLPALQLSLDFVLRFDPRGLRAAEEEGYRLGASAMSFEDIWQQTTKQYPICRMQSRASGETESHPSTLGMKAAAGGELETRAAARHSSAEWARVRSQERPDSGPPRVGQTHGPEGIGGSQTGKGEA